jgi:hypothetical protein
VKSLPSSASGPRTRTGFCIASVVAYSTIIRAGRSLRLHTMARSPVTSPVITPCGTCGRAASAMMIAGAVLWPNASRAAATRPPAPSSRLRRASRARGQLSWVMRNLLLSGYVPRVA